MKPERYELSLAVTDLLAAGLPVTAHVREPDGWRVITVDHLDQGFLGATLDSRQAAIDELFVALPGTRVHGRDFVGAALAGGAHVLTDTTPATAWGPAPGVVLETPDPLAALTVLSACWRGRMPVRVAGVTGSNGKTTTKDLLAAALDGAGPVHATRGNLNSAQGVPVSLLELRPDHRLAVIEMGASDVGHIAQRCRIVCPEVGIITNAADAHLEEFGSLDRIIEGKGELAAALPAHGTAILNADSPGFVAWCERTPARVVSWGQDDGDHRWQWHPGDQAAPGALILDGAPWTVPVPGRHNGANLVAAILAARALGLDDITIAEGLATFRPSPHRAHLRRLGGRLVLDDAYNANPAGMEAAAGMLCDLPGGRAVAVLGHMAELGDDSDQLHEDCGRALSALPLDLLITTGPAAAPLARGFAAGGGAAVTCPSCEAAAIAVADATKAGDRILIKGSRSAGTERVITILQNDHDWTEVPA